MDMWKSKQLAFKLNDLGQVSERPLVFQGVHISFWLPMCFITIYRSKIPLADVPRAILNNPSPSHSATLFLYSMFCKLLSDEVQTAAFKNNFQVISVLQSKPCPNKSIKINQEYSDLTCPKEVFIEVYQFHQIAPLPVSMTDITVQYSTKNRPYYDSAL